MVAEYAALRAAVLLPRVPRLADWDAQLTGANATWSSSSAAAYYLGVEAQLPAILNGKALSLTGLQLCYGASSSASLAYVEVNAIDATSGLGTTTTLGSDASLRTDTACRTYSLAQPHTLAYSEGVGVVIAVNWTSPNTLFRISRTSLILRTTTTDSSGLSSHSHSVPSRATSIGSAYASRTGPSARRIST